MDNLNLYFIAFAWQDDAVSRDWHAAAGYIFAKDAVLVEDLLTEKYGKVSVKSIQPIDIQEGTVLYGSRWHQI